MNLIPFLMNYVSTKQEQGTNCVLPYLAKMQMVHISQGQAAFACLHMQINCFALK